MRQQPFLLVTSFSVLPSLARAFSFQLLNQANQCQNVTFQVTGSGSPPYSLLMVPFGSSTLPNNVEVRKIQNIQFPSDTTNLSVKLVYPANSQFVAVLSDSSGFGTGGTSTVFTVDSSSDASCYDATQNVSPAFYFSISPLYQLVECQATRIWWDNSNNTIEGTPSFQGVIPGGQSFIVPEGSITNVAEEGTGFSWTPSVRAGSTVILVGGDNRALGNAGSSTYIMEINATTNDNSCLNDNSPSSTPGTPAGSYATSTSSSSSGGHSSSGASVGGIAGGVVGGVAGFLIITLLAIFCMRRRRFQKANKERPTLFNDHDDDAPGGRREHLPLYYEPDPFTLPEPTDSGADQSTGPSNDRRQSDLTYVTDNNGRATPDGGTALTGNSRKSPIPPSLRPVNFILHEDAGPSRTTEGEEPETVELPPAYTNIRS